MATERSLFDESRALIGQPVRVQLQDGTATDGLLYCIDPETDHVALLCPAASGYSAKVLMARHVRGIEREPHDSADLPTLAALQRELRGQVSDSHGQEDATSIQRRREQLAQFLTKNFVPFQAAADGSALVLFGGAATLRAPFRAAQSANEQLLRRLQQLLAQFDQQQ
ncbi:Gem-associated protein 6 [Phytophthora cinnamomi]|uniref:Gem-associated protein 6 n=1 Tax=Phytophthora cinnamomi TaxID=4785 RepID=UPI00355A85F5|nr:Gem-associated protein 6 [Phytophthora cinnamomi]